MLTYELRNLGRARWIYGYAGLVWGVSFLTFFFSEGSERALLALMHGNLFVVPLISAAGAANAVYARRRFDEFLLTQPVSRGAVFVSSAGGLLLALVGSFAVPVTAVCALAGVSGELATRVVLSASWLAAVFVLFGVWVGLTVNDRARGLGLVLLVWLAGSVLYDALLLYVIVFFEDYPIENALLAAVALNPVDAVRLALYQDLGLRFLLPVTLPGWWTWMCLALWTIGAGFAAWLVALRKDY